MGRRFPHLGLGGHGGAAGQVRAVMVVRSGAVGVRGVVGCFGGWREGVGPPRFFNRPLVVLFANEYYVPSYIMSMILKGGKIMPIPDDY